MDRDTPNQDYVLPARTATDVAPDVVRALESSALSHRAVDHPFLDEFARGSLGRGPEDAARIYAHGYDGYSRWFPRYLRAVIERLEQPEHRELLAENLAEEQGALCPDEFETLVGLGIDPKTVDGVPHPELFARFRRAVGLSDADVAVPTAATIEWRSTFLGMLRAGSAAYGVGALGLGTESIVSTIYPKLLDGLARIEGLSRDELVFFELHCHVDDQHQEDLLNIARDLARLPGGQQELQRGMEDALELRAWFWDALRAECSRGREAFYG